MSSATRRSVAASSTQPSTQPEIPACSEGVASASWRIPSNSSASSSAASSTVSSAKIRYSWLVRSRLRNSRHPVPLPPNPPRVFKRPTGVNNGSDRPERTCMSSGCAQSKTVHPEARRNLRTRRSCWSSHGTATTSASFRRITSRRASSEHPMSVSIASPDRGNAPCSWAPHRPDPSMPTGAERSTKAYPKRRQAAAPTTDFPAPCGPSRKNKGSASRR